MNYQSFKSTFNLMGAALFIIGLAALASPVTLSWLAWSTIFAGVLCWIGSAYTVPGARRQRKIGGMLLSIGIVFNGLIGLSANAMGWLIWWNLIAGVVGFFVSLSASSHRGQPHKRDTFKRAA